MQNPFESFDNRDLEEQQIQEIADLAVQLLDKRYAITGNFLRGVHPKSHGCVNAVFQVLADIDERFHVGLFAKPGSRFDAVLRFSNADSLVRHDLNKGKHGSRGMALKIRGVTGEVFNQDGDEKTQDFLMINTPQFAFANVEDYLKLQRILLQSNDDATPFFAPLQSPPPTDPRLLADFLRVKQSFEVVSLINRIPIANPLEVGYFGAAPFLFGPDRVMRVSVIPVGSAKEQIVPGDVGENYLREAMAKTLSGSDDIVFDFRVQVRSAGEPDLHIEDATKFWSFEAFPATTLATITIPVPQTDLDGCEQLAFSPWHSLTAHQPLGSINRLRRAVYTASARHRGKTARK